MGNDLSKCCLADKHDEAERIHGRDSEAWLAVFVEPNGMCLLPDGHDGPHVFTPEDEIWLEPKR